MAEVKQILINPELFNLSGGGSRKNKTTTRRNNNKREQNNNGSPISSKAITVSNTPKGKIMRHIQNIYNKEKRAKKQNILKNLFNDLENNNGRTELENSIDYMLNVAKNSDNDSNTNLGSSPNPGENIKGSNPNENITSATTSVLSMVSPIAAATSATELQPKYGCLKNGNLPTYTNYKKMLKNPRINNNNDSSINVEPIININTPLTNSENGLRKFLNGMTNKKTNLNSAGNGNSAKSGAATTGDSIKKLDKIVLNNIGKNLNKKKILRRTFKLGKSKKEPKISVLISNKTIRNQISDKMKDINQIPITYIKNELIKKNLIRVGSTAPNDILREMYKTVKMICGELKNHNTENILYNYVNSHKDKT
jgi:ribosomal protein L18